MSDQFERHEPTPDHLADTDRMRPITDVPDYLADTGPVATIPDHLADTGPVRAVRDRMPLWRRAVGLLSLLGATGLTVGALLLIMTPPDATPAPDRPPVARDATNPPRPTEPPAVENRSGDPVQQVVVLPTIDPNAAASLLSEPLQAVAAASVDIETVRNVYDPFTIIPERPRSGVETYVVESGDTIFGIAERFGLEPESIVWANDNAIVERLRPGRELYILPVNGVYHEVINEQTIGDIASLYDVDPFVIIESEYNTLFGAVPETVLPSGTRVVVPGGQREQISWAPAVERVDGGGGGGGVGARIEFAPGDPGSCGLVDNAGGGGWGPPLSGYEWSRGFTSWHSGVDLSSSMGAPVKAANSGTVIFAGWSSWGYGYTVVLAHGAYTTLYGHLSAINVGCGQYASVGSIIGAVGSSGNSSGPHLHFEVRYLDTPIDPTLIMPF